MLKTLSINVLKFILASIFIIVILEYLLQIYSNIKGIKFTNDNRYSNIYRVYHEGEMFEPYDKFYLYKKNLKEKRFLNFYLDNKKKKLIKIWDYNFSTNNYGLVQKGDLDPSKRSILFLGDSFTQGTGSESWVDNISVNFNEFQIVNAGFGATGFIQFSNLNDHLSSKLNIDKRVVIFISQDIRRNIVIFENTKCLINHLFCNKNNKLIGIPHNTEFNIEKFILKNISKKKTFNLKKKIRFFIKDLYLYQYLRASINYLRLKNDPVVNMNLNTIKDLNEKYKDEILFIRINDAGEIMFKKESYETRVVKNFFEKNKINYFFCDMNDDLSLFHKYDLHPNKKGYKFIENCVLDILKESL